MKKFETWLSKTWKGCAPTKSHAQEMRIFSVIERSFHTSEKKSFSLWNIWPEKMFRWSMVGVPLLLFAITLPTFFMDNGDLVSAGKLRVVHGSVEIVRNGETLTATKGEIEIREGDMVHVGLEGLAEFNPHEDDGENSFFLQDKVAIFDKDGKVVLGELYQIK